MALLSSEHLLSFLLPDGTPHQLDNLFNSRIFIPLYAKFPALARPFHKNIYVIKIVFITAGLLVF